jgi:hypothetical protein
MSLTADFKSADKAALHERLKDMLDTWMRVAAGRVGPRREEISPALLRGALGWVWFVDVIDGGADFRFRLGGDRVIQFMGRRYAGELLSASDEDPFFQRMRAMFLACVRDRRPITVGPERTIKKDRAFLEMEVLALPLSEDGETVTGLCGAIALRPLGELAGGR